MTRRSSLSGLFAMSIFIGSNTSQAYEDDDLLCRPGWSLELYQQQIWEQHNQQRISMMEYQYAMANAAAEQRAREIARIARQEKAARKRAEMIAKRKSESSVKSGAPSPVGQPVKNSLKPIP